jgi:hypothetical protein
MPRVNPPTVRDTSGRVTVTYVNIKGRPVDAVVVGGTGTALNLFIPTMPKASQRPTAVPKRTSLVQTGVWI